MNTDPIFLFSYGRIGLLNQRKSLKKLKPRNEETMLHYYFVPEREGYQSDIARGKKFFDPRDGFLLGALAALGKYGKIETRKIY